jgi:23S rRNA (guanosine2251-2'-O)-methyltransferase
MSQIIVIAHNIRSAHNVGAIFRTCEGFGVDRLILSGYSPYPRTANDSRLPHIADKLTQQIHKTALGAESMVAFEYQPEPQLADLRLGGYVIVGLEQDDRAKSLRTYTPPAKIALLLGEEVEGIDQTLRDMCDDLVEIPMKGDKESFNVSVATGIALYGLSASS